MPRLSAHAERTWGWGWARRSFEVIVKRAACPTISPADDTLFLFFVLPVYKRTIFLPIGPWWYPTSTGYLRFPRVYLHITPSQTGTHVHAPANVPGFSHWTSIRSLSSKPSPPPPFCLRFLVSLFLSFLLLFFFSVFAWTGVKNLI